MESLAVYRVHVNLPLGEQSLAVKHVCYFNFPLTIKVSLCLDMVEPVAVVYTLPLTVCVFSEAPALRLDCFQCFLQKAASEVLKVIPPLAHSTLLCLL